MPTPGNYFIENGKVIKTVPIEINKLQAHLPPPDRNRLKHYTIVFNPELTGSPARNFTGKGLIETGTKFKTYPAQLRLFILLHEMAHFWYKAESDCDLWAAIHFIGMGYNNSTALYLSLIHI